MTLPTETIAVAGLNGEVEILIDRWGIPHIYAPSQDAAFFAQGFNAARDRLWQIDLWRKRGLGLMAGDFGPAYVERDRAARLHLYRGDMDAEWAAYGTDAKAWTTAFVAGINAYVALTEKEPDRLPVEFRMTGTKPARWAPEDVVRCRAHARVRNLDAEITRSNLYARFGKDADKLHKALQPDWDPIVPEGLAPHPIPPEVMRTQTLATEPNALANLGTPAPKPDAAAITDEGSNNWALAPSRTTTGRAILASDPHRVHEQPSLRYITHLVAPGLDVIGSGEPAVPGVSFGHNDRIAFALTIHPADQEDLYVYDLDPADPTRYRYGDGWEAMRIVKETIPVRGEADRTVELAFTRHGPVLHVDAANNRAYALRSIWWEPGTAAYLNSLGFLKAKDWQGYLAALDNWGAPSSNHVVADVDGNIGFGVGAKIPVRPNWDGLLPVPGDGRYEWKGVTASPDLPRSYNPASGWVGSANQYNLPPGYDTATRRTGFEWSDDTRFRRLSGVLDAPRSWSVDDVLALQADVTSVQAQRLTALLPALKPASDAARQAVALLAAWDHRLAADSAGAALYEVWWSKHVVPGTMQALAPEGMPKLVAVPDTRLILMLLEAPDARFGADPAAARDALLLRTLEAAWDEVAKLLGADPAVWKWGALHRGFFEHPLSRHLPKDAAEKLNVGPLPKAGSASTLNNNGYRTSDFRVISGVSWRMVVDVGNWDASWTVNSPGQSGDPRSPHYRDLFPIWAEDKSVPLLYSRAAVEGAAEQRIVLKGG